MTTATSSKRLLLLGTTEVRGDALDAESLARIQPKRTALLAYLALAGGPVRRDSLLGLLWPELDDSQARRALNQAIFHLRRSLGDGAIESGGMESVALNFALVSCDATEFEQQCRDGELEAAMALYRGPFLNGFHVGDLEDLERWVESTRSRFAVEALSACTRLADQHASADPRAALVWARRAHGIAPSDATIRRVIALHDALGDRSGAIREYEQFAKWVAQELGVEPSPETRQLVDGIKVRAEPVSIAPEAPVAARAVFSPGAAPMAASNPPAKHSHNKRSLLRLGVAAAAVIILVMAATSLATNRRRIDEITGTASREARTEYRAGEDDLAAGRFEAAVEHFRRAIVADSAFAMAHYRLSLAANWTAQSTLASSAALRAGELSASLSPIERARVEAWRQYLRGEITEARPLYLKLAASDPLDFDAAFFLAEIGFHWGPTFGTSSAASADAWDRVLGLQPDNAGAIIHRLRLSAIDADSIGFDSLARRLAGLNPSADHQIEVRALRAFTFGDSAARAASVAEIGQVEVLRRSVVHDVLYSARDIRHAARQLIPLLFMNQNFTSFEHGEFLLGAQMSSAVGDIPHALITIDSVALLQPDRALEYRAMLASIPDVPLPAGFRATVRRALDGPMSPRTTYSTGPAVREYFGALLALRDGDLPAARRKLEALIARAPRLGAGHDTTLTRHVDRMARIVGAEIARAAGHPDSALVLLGEPTVEPDRRIPYVWSYPRAEERLLRGELLSAVGKKKEALAWFATFPDPGLYDFAYLPYALKWQVKLASELGDTRALASAAVWSARLQQ